MKLLSACKAFVLTVIFFAGMLLLPGFSKSGWGQMQTQTFNANGTFIVPAGVTPNFDAHISTVKYEKVIKLLKPCAL